MPHLLIITAAQLKAYRERFEKLLAQDQAEQERLRQIDERREAEWKQLHKTRPLQARKTEPLPPDRRGF